MRLLGGGGTKDPDLGILKDSRLVPLSLVSSSSRRMLGCDDEGMTVLQKVQNTLPSATESYAEELNILIAYV